MNYLHVSAPATIEVPNYTNLIAAWRIHGGPGTLVGSFIVTKPLTGAQLRRLPRDLKERLA